MSSQHKPILPASQPELLERERYPDRNLHHGGRSFYFFDFDDNVMSLDTPIFLFHRHSGEELQLSTAEFAQVSPQVGQPGPYHDYEIDLNDYHGSFRRFRDLAPHEDAAGREQPFVEDLRSALARPDFEWRGPSWELFFHAVHNRRPLSIITARGHHPTTLARGVELLHQGGHLTQLPRYVSIFPVSHPQIREDLSRDQGTLTVPELKLEAILRSVAAAMTNFGENPHHRFGMSDDSPENLELITAAMVRLKQRYPQNAFFVIDSSKLPLVKTEILLDHTESEEVDSPAQLSLFGPND